ncbi:hypothetical protein Sru01_11610 [Sphaerisporangium rufum]|uniref:Uncharacterized protein n=1 Tax=Sphaerisporangium rufum TaxID=1381558 RepID=A0A919QXX8_9ACTN|nr:hypothetical protein [Sphaerisporangium rufum]GII76179.1 hypothetical protein Sru01_11610 [Sphaerisporangium rufum]
MNAAPALQALADVAGGHGHGRLAPPGMTGPLLLAGAAALAGVAAGRLLARRGLLPRRHAAWLCAVALAVPFLVVPATAATPGGPAPATGRRGGADAAECASAELGALAAGGRAPAGCPADRLAAPDAAALRSIVRFLAGRGERAVALAADGSPRGAAAAAEVRAAAARARITVTAPDTAPGTAAGAAPGSASVTAPGSTAGAPPGTASGSTAGAVPGSASGAAPGTASGAVRRPLIVVGGWTAAGEAVRAVAAGRLVAQGTYLAPWLLAAPLLAPSAGQLIPLRYAPGDAGPAAYLAALAELRPGEPATSSGYAAWRRARGEVRTGPATLYAAARLYVPGSGGLAVPGAGAAGGAAAQNAAAGNAAPRNTAAGNTAAGNTAAGRAAAGNATAGNATAHHGTGGWLPNGMIIPVSGPLDDR